MRIRRGVEYVRKDTGQTGFMADERPGKEGEPFLAKKPTARRFARQWREKHPEWDFVVVKIEERR